MKVKLWSALFAASCSVSCVMSGVASADPPPTPEPTSIQFVVGELEAHVPQGYMGWSVLVTSPAGTPVLQPGQVTFTVADAGNIVGTFAAPIDQPSPSGWTNFNPMPNGTVCVFGVSPQGMGFPPPWAMQLGPCTATETALPPLGGSPTTPITVQASYSGAPGWAPACSSAINLDTLYDGIAEEALNVPCPGQSALPPPTEHPKCGDCATTTTITTSTNPVPWFAGYDAPFAVKTFTATVDSPNGSLPTVSNGEVMFTVADNGPVAQRHWSYPAFAAGANTAQCGFVLTDIGQVGADDATSPCNGNATVGLLPNDQADATISALYVGDTHWLPSASTTLGFLQDSTPTPLLSYSCVIEHDVSLALLSWTDGPGTLFYEGETQGTVQASSPYPVQDATGWTFAVTVNGQQSNTINVAC